MTVRFIVTDEGKSETERRLDEQKRTGTGVYSKDWGGRVVENYRPTNLSGSSGQGKPDCE